MFEYENLDDPGKLFSQAVSPDFGKVFWDQSKGWFNFLKLRIFEDPFCYRIRDVPGLGPGGFDVEPLRPENGVDCERNMFTREETVAHCQVIKNLVFSQTGGIVYFEFNSPELEERALTAPIRRGARGLMELLSIIDSHATSSENNDINQVAQELLTFISFDDVKDDVLLLAANGQETELPAKVDRWLWWVLCSSGFDRGL